MNRHAAQVRVLAPVALFFAASGCASILGGGTSQPVSMVSLPTSATFTVRSSSGIQMAQGQTPQSISLPRRNEYQIEVAAKGFQTQTVALTRGLNGWVWGNFLVGWIIGFAVDFIDGAAYKLEPALVAVSLVQIKADNGTPGTGALVELRSQSGRLIRRMRVPLVPVTP